MLTPVRNNANIGSKVMPKTPVVFYRILYFFHFRVAAVLAHGLVKENEVPKRDIELAIQRKGKFELDPERHTFKE
jgi:phage-related protein